MVMNAVKYSSSCVLSNLVENTSPGVLSAPCGTVHVKNDVQAPLLLTWNIEVWRNFKIQTTMNNINIVYEDLRCSNNFLRLHDTSSVADIAKLCGRASQKIFYSNTSSVTIVLSLLYTKPSDNDTTVAIMYQVQSKSGLIMAKLFPKEPQPNKVDLQQFLALTPREQLKIYFYSTLIVRHVHVAIRWRNCTSRLSTVSVFDGPNSRSKLLSKSQWQENSQTEVFLSSLSILSIYLTEEQYLSSSCLHTSATTIRTRAKYHQITITARPQHIPFSNIPETENYYRLFRIQVPEDRFLNFKINKLVYTGSTEAGCYLGGFLIYLKGRLPIGPMCGESGRIMFEDERLEGLTLSSHMAHLILFVFADKKSTLFLNLTISSDECEGISNPRHLSNTQHSVLKGKQFDLYQAGINSLRLLITVQRDVCIKMQVFFDNYNPKTCIINFDRGPAETTFLTRIKMVTLQGYGNLAPYRVISKSFYNHFINEETDGRKIDAVFTPNVTYVESSFKQHRFLLIIAHELENASMFDGVTVITIRSVGGNECQKYKLELLNPTNPFEKLYDVRRSQKRCSLGEAETTHGVYGRLMFFFPGSQTNISLSISSVDQQCAMKEKYVYLEYLYDNHLLSFTWTIRNDTFQWTFADFSITNIITIHVYIAIYSHGSTTLNDIIMGSKPGNLVFNSPSNTSLKCRYNIRLEDSSQPVESKSNQSKSNLRVPMVFNSNRHAFCFLNICYYTYTRRNTSWNSAKDLCEEYGQQLLTINSDVEAKFIDKILYTDIDRALSPVLFLNMKHNSTQVSFR